MQCIGQVVGIYRQTLIIYLRYVCMNTIRCTRRNCHRTYICSMCRWLRKLIAVLFTAHNCNHMIEFLVWVRIPTNIYIFYRFSPQTASELCLDFRHSFRIPNCSTIEF